MANESEASLEEKGASESIDLLTSNIDNLNLKTKNDKT